MDFRQALDHLDRHIDHEARAGHIEGLSLASMHGLMSVLDDPQRAYRVIHVTGTNGKGTVAHLASGLVMASGLQVGTYTSPHLVSITERLRRDGEPISEEDFGRVVGEIASISTLVDTVPSYFEIVTAAAFAWFAEIAVDVAIVEVGLLGRFDATNVVDGDVSVVTSLGRDHTDGAPGWERAVAGEKAGILRPERPAVIGDVGDTLDVFVAEGPDPVRRLGDDLLVEVARPAVGGQLVDIATAHGTYEDVFVPLFGDHQAANAAIAIAATEELLGRALDVEVVNEGLAAVTVPGRFEIVHTQPTVVIDGAHNPTAAATLDATLREVLGAIGRRVLVVGLLDPHEPAAMLDALAVGAGDLVIACRAPSPRAVDAATIAEAARARGADTEQVDDVAQATLRAITVADPDDVVVVCGSFYLYAQASAVAERLGPGEGADAGEPPGPL